MKKLFTLSTVVLITYSVFAQSPQKMSYQCVVRNSTGALVTNQSVGLKISILQGTISGTAVYQEIYNPDPQTNANGLLSLEIGGGLPITGIFSSIDWAAGPFFLKTETDPTGGTNYTVVGISQLLSVPYAMYAKTAGNAFSGNYNDLTNQPTLFSGNYNDLTNKPTLFNGTWINLIGKPNTLAGYGITDAIATTGDQTIAGNKTFSGTTTVSTPVNATDATTKAYVDAILDKLLETQAELGAKDIDGNTYKSVKIGTQVWMAENLKTTKYNNGDLIGTTTPATLDISGETTPKYQWTYDGNESNVNTYGRLYTWYAVMDSRNVCPTGWHIPTDAEWTILTDYLTNNGYGYQGSGNDIGKSIANTSGWTTYTTAGTVGDDQISNNSSGFTALPSGYRGLNGGFDGINLSAYWWSSTELSATHVYYRRVYYLSISVDRDYAGSQNGFSVRCLKN
jgi:uncharacterized protein (TIGR02145 family)